MGVSALAWPLASPPSFSADLEAGGAAGSAAGTAHCERSWCPAGSVQRPDLRLHPCHRSQGIWLISPVEPT